MRDRLKSWKVRLGLAAFAVLVVMSMAPGGGKRGGV